MDYLLKFWKETRALKSEAELKALNNCNAKNEIAKVMDELHTKNKELLLPFDADVE